LSREKRSIEDVVREVLGFGFYFEKGNHYNVLNKADIDLESGRYYIENKF
jgi:hypothetical protein